MNLKRNLPFDGGPAESDKIVAANDAGLFQPFNRVHPCHRNPVGSLQIFQQLKNFVLLGLIARGTRQFQCFQQGMASIREVFLFGGFLWFRSLVRTPFQNPSFWAERHESDPAIFTKPFHHPTVPRIQEAYSSIQGRTALETVARRLILQCQPHCLRRSDLGCLQQQLTQEEQTRQPVDPMLHRDSLGATSALWAAR